MVDDLGLRICVGFSSSEVSVVVPSLDRDSWKFLENQVP